MRALPLIAALLFAGTASADPFADCFHRIELACRHEVYASYGCTADGHGGPPPPKACKGREEGSVVVRGQVVHCGTLCPAPRSTLDQCVSAATNHCAPLLDAPVH